MTTPVTENILISEASSGPHAQRSGLTREAVRQIWDNLGEFIFHSLKNGKGVVLPGLGTFQIGHPLHAGCIQPSEELIPTFTLNDRFGAVSQERGKWFPNGKLSVISTVLRDMLSRLGIFILSGRSLSVTFGAVGQFRTRARRVEFRFPEGILETEEDSEEATFPYPLNDPLVHRPSRLHKAKPYDSPGRSQSGNTEGPLHTHDRPLPKEAARLLRACRREDRVGSGCMPRLAIERLMRQHCKRAMKGVYADTIFDLIEKHTRGNTGKFIKYLPFVGALHELDGWEDYGDEENEDPEDQSDSPQGVPSSTFPDEDSADPDENGAYNSDDELADQYDAQPAGLDGPLEDDDQAPALEAAFNRLSTKDAQGSELGRSEERLIGVARSLDWTSDLSSNSSMLARGGRKPTSVMQEIEAFNRDQLARRKDGEMYEGYKRNKCPSPQRLTSRREIDDYNKPQLEESVDRRLHFKKREVTDKVTGSQGARILAGCPSALLKEIRPPPTSKAQLDAKVAQLARPIDMPSMTNIMAREQDAVAAKRRATGDMLRRTWSEQTVEKERLRSAQQKSEATWPYVATSSVPSRRAKLRSTCM
ncbi:hypothetical protein CYMTET_5725 [Cymbomonas tetramitiformis]|uniref:CCDC81 HU domain-containing protein n=1 Tax=Cymbomonas tetramitiformis TaxID=36881 RepID=A0AAE0GYI7_9CHLO|nr:hypothetical protein CYMTET_5725 [Cymbomonas tetramitiformis]